METDVGKCFICKRNIHTWTGRPDAENEQDYDLYIDEEFGEILVCDRCLWIIDRFELYKNKLNKKDKN